MTDPASRRTPAPMPLPRPISSFVGRAAELAQLRELVTSRRLVALVGPGGCGKTRLALEFVANPGPAPWSGTGFVDLSVLQEPAAIPEAVTVALGLSAQGSRHLVDLIADRPLLLLIDNVEHLADAVSDMVANLLTCCPGVHVLLTGRSALDIPGEVVWQVPPLGLPHQREAGGLDPNPERLATFDAVRLFVTRASERRGDFALTARNARLVVDVCRRLDGIPLAIELAAARLGSIALGEILADLDDGFRLLDSEARGVIPRHRTMRAALDWSCGLLPEPERTLFSRLGVFVGGFDLAAIEAVCSAGEPPLDVRDAVRRLVEASLVTARLEPDGGVRYSLLQVFRQYALAGLGEELRDVRARHAVHYAAVAQRLDTRTADDAEWRLERMDLDYENCLNALDWAAEEDPALERELFESLRWYWRVRGLIREVHKRLQSLLASEPRPSIRRAHLLICSANLALALGYYESAVAEKEESVALTERFGETAAVVGVLHDIALFEGKMGDLHSSERHLRAALEHYRGRTPGRGLLTTLNNLSVALMLTERPDEALDLVEQALELGRQLGDIPESGLLSTYGAVLLALNRGPEARDAFMRSLELDSGMRNYHHGNIALHGLACAAASAGDPVTCMEMLGAARSCWELSGTVEREWTVPVEEAERASRSALGEAAARRAWERGRRLDPTAALERARSTWAVRPETALPPRKLAIVRLVAAGMSNKEIAERLAISVRSVEAHLDQVRKRLQLRNRAQLVRWAITNGVAVEPAPATRPTA